MAESDDSLDGLRDAIRRRGETSTATEDEKEAFTGQRDGPGAPLVVPPHPVPHGAGALPRARLAGGVVVGLSLRGGPEPVRAAVHAQGPRPDAARRLRLSISTSPAPSLS